MGTFTVFSAFRTTPRDGSSLTAVKLLSVALQPPSVALQPPSVPLLPPWWLLPSSVATAVGGPPTAVGGPPTVELGLMDAALSSRVDRTEKKVLLDDSIGRLVAVMALFFRAPTRI